jgi:hypothetical protein
MFSPSSLTAVKLIPVERMNSAFLVSLLTAFSLFRLQLPFERIDFFKTAGNGQRILSRSSFGFKSSHLFFLLFKFGDCSAISSVVVVLVAIVIPLVGSLMILRRLAYTTGKRFRYPYYLLVVKKHWDRWCA